MPFAFLSIPSHRIGAPQSQYRIFVHLFWGKDLPYACFLPLLSIKQAARLVRSSLQVFHSSSDTMGSKSPFTKV